MSATLVSAVVGAVIGGGISILVLKVMSQKMAASHPVLTIAVPENAESSPEWQAWAQENGFKAKDGQWVKGTGMLTSFSEIRFDGGRMEVRECVNFLFGINRFALNAPGLFAKPVRARKLKKLNELLAQWQLPPVAMQ